MPGTGVLWDAAAHRSWRDPSLGDEIGSGECAGRVPPGLLESFTCSLPYQAPSCAAGRGTGLSSTWMAAWFTTTMRHSGTWMAGSTSSTAAGMCGLAASAKVSPAPVPELCIPNPIPHVAAPLLTHAPPVHIQHTPKITQAASFTPPHSQAGHAGAALPVLFLVEGRKGKKEGKKGGREEGRISPPGLCL